MLTIREEKLQNCEDCEKIYSLKDYVFFRK